MREEGADTIHTTVQRLVFVMKMKLNKMNTFSFLPTCSTLWIPAACFFFFFSFLFFQPRRVRCARSPLLSTLDCHFRVGVSRRHAECEAGNADVLRLICIYRYSHTTTPFLYFFNS